MRKSSRPTKDKMFCVVDKYISNDMIQDVTVFYNLHKETIKNTALVRSGICNYLPIECVFEYNHIRNVKIWFDQDSQRYVRKEIRK